MTGNNTRKKTACVGGKGDLRGIFSGILEPVLKWVKMCLRALRDKVAVGSEYVSSVHLVLVCFLFTGQIARCSHDLGMFELLNDYQTEDHNGRDCLEDDGKFRRRVNEQVRLHQIFFPLNS